MKKRPVNIFKIPWYFIAFSSYPVLALLSYNISEVRFTSGIRSLVLSVVGATVLFLLFRLIYRSWHRAAFAVTALALLFFSYGHIYDLLFQKIKFQNFTLFLLGVCLVIAILALVWAGWHKTKFNKATLGLNIVSLGLVLVVLVQVIWWSLPLRRGEIADDHAPLQALYIPSGETLPDIYYIIPDSYGRSDLLLQSYQIDNTAFIQRLQEMGFYVAGCSQSNYNRTDISLGSSLNMDYLQNLDDSYKPENQNGKTLLASINQNAVRYELERAGYKTVAFATGFAWSEITNANIYFAPSPDWFELNSFETLLIRTTMGRHFEALGGIHLDQIDGQWYRERTQLVLSSMHELSHLPGPKFVFIHIISPHPPFVYGPDGTPTDPAAFLDQSHVYEADAYARGYTNQVEYISGQLVIALSTLLRESSTPPVIILQGDHGPWMQTGSNMFEILNAYYLPGHNDLLYSSISPVNTFRLVLDTYLGTDYPLLDDISYFSPIPNIYAFIKTANPCLNHKG